MKKGKQLVMERYRTVIRIPEYILYSCLIVAMSGCLKENSNESYRDGTTISLSSTSNDRDGSRLTGVMRSASKGSTECPGVRGFRNAQDEQSDADHDLYRGENCAAISVPVQDSAGGQYLERLFRRRDIPGISGQPTQWGRTLQRLIAFDGRLHIAYGDYDDNTGPIPMSAYDPIRDRWDYLGTLSTEEVRRFHVNGQYLYIPNMDAVGHYKASGLFRLGCGENDWWTSTPCTQDAIHVYDLAFQGDDIFAAVAGSDRAMVTISKDGGRTWRTIFERLFSRGVPRFHHIAVLPNNQLYISGQKDWGDYFSFIGRQGGSFQRVSNSPSRRTLIPIVFNNDFIIAAFEGSVGTSRYRGSYRINNFAYRRFTWPIIEGEEVQLRDWFIELNGTRLVVLAQRRNGEYLVARTTSFTNHDWDIMARINSRREDFTSMALLLNNLYLGTQNGDLWVMREFAQPAF